jgi:uncharacterized membrane protein YeaQ/YmgE (transglycosylase-associated protein family)
MGLLSWVVLGAVVALVARELVPGPDPGRLVVAAILGIAGASFGGFVVGVLAGPGAMGFSVWSALAAMLGAVALLLLYGMVARRTA